MADPKGFSTISSVLDKFKTNEDKYISQEFQKYGYELAKVLNDLKNKSLYIKLAKSTPRGLLETAKNFVKDANNVQSPARLFMWKLKELKAKKVETQEERRRQPRTLMWKLKRVEKASKRKKFKEKQLIYEERLSKKGRFVRKSL